MKNRKKIEAIHKAEEEFHDGWAINEAPSDIDVFEANEVCTAPEMRYITKYLGNLDGKSILDIGCGLGEASVYFAIKGADVTALDLSQGMLDYANKLAKKYNVSLKTCKATAENFNLDNRVKYDVIYVGNLFHHVEIEKTIKLLKNYLKENGVLISWDPLAYNPAINLYRLIATNVRTEDEHPLKYADIKLFKKHFEVVETKFFWLTTLIIFILMVFIQFKNPNKERLWKVVQRDGKFWKPLYYPLEIFDKILLFIFPFLSYLCWNVVIISKMTKK
jgi:2-polyprenyl-3-methyl-5-hydroxy-6-metoxy-1,4-benzoquinol methylase